MLRTLCAHPKPIVGFRSGAKELAFVCFALRVLATEVARVVRVAFAVVDGDLWMGTERARHLHGSVAYA